MALVVALLPYLHNMGVMLPLPTVALLMQLTLEQELVALGVHAKGYQSNAASFEEAQTLVDNVSKDFEGIDIQSIMLESPKTISLCAWEKRTLIK